MFWTVVETLRGAGLYVMTKGGPFELLICGRGFRISLDVGWYVPGRTGLLTRLISFLRKWRLYPHSSRKFISSLQRLLKKSSVEQMDGGVRRGWKGWCALCGQDGRRFLEDIGACLTVLCGDQFLFGYCWDRLEHIGREDCCKEFEYSCVKHDGWVGRILVMYESFKVIFSLFPYHVDAINKPPPDVRLEKGVFNCRLL